MAKLHASKCKNFEPLEITTREQFANRERMFLCAADCIDRDRCDAEVTETSELVKYEEKENGDG